MADEPDPARPLAPPPDRDARRRALVRVGLLFAVIAAAVLYGTLSGVELSPERIRAELQLFREGSGPLLFVAATIALSSLAVPSAALGGAAGLLYGTALGALVAHTGIVLAACFQLLLARHVAREPAGALVPARLRPVDEVLKRRGFLAVLLYRTIPGLPFITLNYSAGLTRLRVRDMFLGTLIGKAPRTWAYAALGGNLDDLGSPTAIAAIALIAAMAIGGLLLGWRQLAAERVARVSGGGLR